ncbi:RimK family alpha-L-glutamate ligase [Streptomyces sp. NPDC092903]|uniref:ATP-grasp domain-containing protein n=1 Tax=Streptomyces sp. NPDC092903 TaxID=3366017 RepID=UPI0037FA5689
MITHQTDTGIDRLMLELHALGADVVRFDLADCPTQVHITATLSDHGWEGTVEVRGRTVDLARISAILRWHPGPPRIPGTRPAAERQWMTRETTAGLGGVLSSLPCRHINHPVAVRGAQVKAEVLARAASLGLTVPPTVITSRSDAARRVAGAGPTVLKALTEPVITQNATGADVLFTRPFTARDAARHAGYSTLQLQQHITNSAYDVRLFVVGDQVLAFRIDPARTPAPDDIRAAGPLTVTPCTVPDSVAEGAVALTADFALSYAALDFLADDVRHWLLDLNPAGQFSAVESARDLPAVSRLLAGHLTAQSAPHRRTAAPAPATATP